VGTRRLGFALVAALIISVSVTSIFYVRMVRTQGSARPKTRSIVGARVALQPGTPIAAEDLTQITWPQSVALDGLIEKKEDVSGHVLVYAVAANEPVMRRDLASSSSLGLAARIPDGMRASAVKTNEVMNVAGFIFPGSRVDVLVTLRGETNSASSTTTRTVLQNVQVLSTGAKTEPDPSGKPENVTVVTLLVTPEQSEKLALAQNQGTIQFVLRNGGDSANRDTPAVDMAELAGTHKEPPAQPQPAHATRIVVAEKPAGARAAELYVVETVANGKVTMAKFPANPE